MITDSRSWEVTRKSTAEIQKSDNGPQQGLAMEVVLNSQSLAEGQSMLSREWGEYLLPGPLDSVSDSPQRLYALQSMNSIKSFLCSASHWVWPEEFPVKFSQKEYWHGI